MSVAFFKNNRKKLFQKMGKNTGAVFFNGHAPRKRGDEYYPFSPDRNFYYLTGIEKENEILFCFKDGENERTILYIERENPEEAKWVGETISKEACRNLSGIEEIHTIDAFTEEFAAILFKSKITSLYLDLEKRDWKEMDTPALLFCREVNKKYPSLEIVDSFPVMEKFREIKEAFEIDLIKKAIAVTKLGIEEMLSHMEPDMSEYEMEAYFDFVLKKNGVREKAFQTIAAGGKRGTILHYTANNERVQDGEMVLFDLGAQVGWYNGDISRTFPINGKFTPRQKQIYEIVLEGQKKVIEAIKPGVPFYRLNDILKEHYYKALKEIGLVKKREEVSQYYYHSVSHYLGAFTHDVGRYGTHKLKKGMVLTVEPGLYIEEYGLGIRIEDNILVTEKGCENLSKDILKTVEEIEAFMAGAKNHG